MAERVVYSNVNTVQERIRYWRSNIKGLSLREFQKLVNAQLPGAEVSLGTVSNYEQVSSDGVQRGGPRASFVGAMKRAFPELRLAWLLLGQGEPTRMAQQLTGQGGLEGTGDEAGGEDSLTGRVLRRYPDLDLLSPEASALFAAALARYAMGEPDMHLTEEHLIELAGDLRWLLLLPTTGWGFEHEPDYDRFSAYCVAMLHALMQAMPGSGQGDPVADYQGSGVRALREGRPVKLGA
jgi:hypothetical protein